VPIGERACHFDKGADEVCDNAFPIANSGQYQKNIVGEMFGKMLSLDAF
tara:strand:+ start:11 stop:157 length:147 start_codon:yes stop_codon:yes gene_type:complete